MKAARLVAPQTFDFVDLDEPTPVDGQAKIRIEATSVCGSDIHGIYHGATPEEGYPLAPGGSTAGTAYLCISVLP